MDKLSRTQELIILASKKGYKIIDNICYNPKGKMVNGTIKRNPVPYRLLFLSVPEGKRAITFHGLVAYQKYGVEYFTKGTVARHLDGDSLNNHENNIILGTMKDNTYDIPSKRRSQRIADGAKTIKKMKDGLKDTIWEEHLSGKFSSQQIANSHDICINTVYKVIREYRSKIDT